MNSYTRSFRELNRTMLSIAGSKAANLAELMTIPGIHVPEGFCITTEAYQQTMKDDTVLNHAIDELEQLQADQRRLISTAGSRIRNAMQKILIAEEIKREIAGHLSRIGDAHAYAVRSSATAEDLPGASFAGQQDTFLNVTGIEAVCKHVGQCWASLFTDRAIIYRIQKGIDHRRVLMSVIVQRMIFADVSGILFTADPVSSNRKIISIDAGFGLGEAMVSGLVNADNYKVRDGQIIDQQIAIKKMAVYASADGGTKEQPLDKEKQTAHALTAEQVLRLEVTGRKIEQYFGSPQDIEWSLAGNKFYILQSRPVTTLFPVPEADDQEGHVYVSVGHQQMMTDAMKPLGISFWQLTMGRPMFSSAGRLFVDVAGDLASPAKRDILVSVLGRSDPFMMDALLKILERNDLIRSAPADPQPASDVAPSGPSSGFLALNDYDPGVVGELIAKSQRDIQTLHQEIKGRSGTDLIDFILKDLQRLRARLSDPKNFGVIITGINAAGWLNEKMNEWLGEKNVADTISLSVPDNITSQMGLELIDIADLIRPYSEMVAYLRQTKDEHFLHELAAMKGGEQVRDALGIFLDKYGMRCAGEIDITRERWRERPLAIVPVLLSNIKNLEAGASRRKFEKGLSDASDKEQDLLRRLKELPDGDQKANETKRMIGIVRNLGGYREYPKYDIVSCYFIYRQALLNEAELLLKENVITSKDDIYYLSMDELNEVIKTRKTDHALITKRKTDQLAFEKLFPPRIITSDGEVFSGEYRPKDLPAGAIAGLGVSSGIVEGRARVILKMEEADLEEGDILVTRFTDPGWTPLFVSVKGLVTEVGGLMTHGAVIAREYGLPAVVGVENATTLIKDGDWIIVNGGDGTITVADRTLSRIQRE